MENRIQETIDRILLNSSYNVKMTLTENLTNVITKVGRVGSATLKQLAKFKYNRNILMDVEAMSKLLKLTDKEFETQLKNAIRKDLAKGVPVGTIGNNTRDIMKVKEIKEATNRAATLTKGEKLSKDAISEISKRVESDVTQLTREVSESSIKAAEKRAAKLAKDAGKTVADDVKNLGGTTSFLTKFRNITTWQGFKDSLKKWGLVTVLSAAALYALWNYFYGDKPVPEDAEKIEGVPPPVVKPPVVKPPVVKPPVQSRYRTNCKGTYTKWCKSPVVAEVQRCLGLVPDGKFGPKTDAALKAKEFDIGFTDNDVKRICNTNVIPPKEVQPPIKLSDEDTLADNQGDASAENGL